MDNALTHIVIIIAGVTAGFRFDWKIGLIVAASLYVLRPFDLRGRHVNY